MTIQILTSVAFYFVLMLLSVNLLGLFVRGLFSNPELDKLKQTGHEFIKHEIKKSQRADKLINTVAFVFIITYFYFLLHFWNIGVMLVAIIIMAGRFPDLLWEIKHGKKMTYSNANSLPKNALFFITAFLPWIGLPVLYYFLYYF